MRLLEARRIEQVAPGCRLLAIEPWLPKLRQVKDDIEIAAMRRAVEIAEHSIQRLLEQDAVRPGRTEREIAADLQIAMLRAGSQGEAFAPLVLAGPNSAQPHASPSDRPLAEGDLLIVDWGAVYKGYRSDITRTFVLGEPTAEMLRIHDAVLAANQSARLGIRPGMPGQEIDRLARRSITLAGYGEHFLHRTGHGLGLETHEPPYLVEGNLQLLEAGQTFTVEPGIYVPGLGGVRIEDDVVVTEDGSETLTSLPRELVRLPY
jgi:Xaa-Pro dipeptidase